MAFRDYNIMKGIAGSDFVGLKHFIRFVQSYNFWNLIRNTILLNLYQLFFVFPVPIVFALLLKQIGRSRLRKFLQNIAYAPHFISMVVLVGTMYIFLSPRTGIVNIMLQRLGNDSIFFFGDASWFRPLFILSEIWQNTGWAAVIYIAVLSSVDPNIYDAAKVDGASKLQRLVHIDVPSLVPTIVILFILKVGRLMTVGFEKAYLMQTPLNYDTSEIIATYVYKIGLIGAQYSFASAVGLFNAAINFTLLIVVNKIVKNLSENALW
ncbi:MAG: sugar ABC transporter permease [Spirochaetales bacterium]|nr:sugar ABC transporter permease [Spirochaetales bacterium]